MKPRVAIVDDHVLLAEALERVLDRECEVVAVYSDPLAFLADAPKLKLHVVILDVAMPRLSGLSAARELRRLLPNVRIIFLTMNEDVTIAAEAFRIGASGYVLKRCASGELTQAVREVMNNRFYVTPALTKELVGNFVQDDPRKSSQKLTARQREVLQLLVEGYSMKETAAILHVSARTVAFHKYRMMEHLQVDSTAALIQFAVREGLV